MSDSHSPNSDIVRHTGRAFFWIRIFSTPFYVIFTLLPYILYKDLGATLLQTTFLVALKPTISFIAPYVTLNFIKRPDRVVHYLVGAAFLKYLPFLLIPWLESVWTFIFLTLFFLVLERGVMPAWIELLKEGLPKEKRTKLFSFTQSIDYLAIALFPMTLGWLLDLRPESWRFLFPLCAVVAVIPLPLLFRVAVSGRPPKNREAAFARGDILRPWVDAVALLRARPDFALFQLGFMVGGSGLMLIQAGLPLFFNDILRLSYQEITFAIAFCKGIGFAFSSPFWARFFNSKNIFFFCSRVTFISAAFPLILLASQFETSLVYFAYIIYGVMQGGSELSWHMSGPVFEEKENSALYTTTSILAQGIRGLIMPFLGYLICQFMGPSALLVMALLFALSATAVMAHGYRRFLPSPQKL